MSKQISVDGTVKFQLHEQDKKCNQGQGVVKQCHGNVIEIKPDEEFGSETLHRYLVGNDLKIKNE